MLIAACMILGAIPLTEEREVYAQCGAAMQSYGCSSSQGFSSYGGPMMYRSAPMYQGPVFNSAGQCLNCGRFHGPMQADPFVNVQPPKVQFGIINFARRASAPAMRKVEYVEKTKVTTKFRWGKVKFKVNEFTGICSVR